MSTTTTSATRELGGAPRSAEVTPESFGRDVLGPVVAEFCLRLWTLGTQLERPEDTAMLFCARGGLRMQLAHERFLASSGLPTAVSLRPLMVSRLAAVRPVLVRTPREGLDHLLPSAAAALAKEFAVLDLGAAVKALSGVGPEQLPAGAAAPLSQPFTPDGLAALLRSPDGALVTEALEEQADLFVEHLRQQLDGRQHALLVDTGLYGTTRDLLAEAGLREQTSCALIARSFRPGTAADHRTYGLSVTAHDYSLLQRRSVLLRYWHFVEWLFEPPLRSTSRFERRADGRVVADTEVDGWEDLVVPAPGTPFAGVLAYLDALPPAPAEKVVLDADRAWGQLHRAVVLPTPDHGWAMSVEARSHGFGREETWTQPEQRGLLEVLRSDGMWREGEVARSATPLRLPVLLAVEALYGLRNGYRAVRRRAPIAKR
ncbi:hypothetical protein SAMN06264364_10442 [Quadrisphaera granulorum]|uniref:Uncharacterized protein n=1 Tax=Quadrisphaera granulorum TaxID=317664 RepID=A0A316ABX9_9ACTN|nr:hypothetical protein [Quadrisphaera granulorum]PWJ55121.1 hypothetical protein BXY45_10442 [Quadrisphaera granulorum]SZE95630.1 hypothetical protein SAMN06264364_10442 [Quadrisphaera granulorum]